MSVEIFAVLSFHWQFSIATHGPWFRYRGNPPWKTDPDCGETQPGKWQL